LRARVVNAIGCQRTIAQKIIDKKADYILALKSNEGALQEDVEVLVAEQKTTDLAAADTYSWSLRWRLLFAAAASSGARSTPRRRPSRGTIPMIGDCSDRPGENKAERGTALGASASDYKDSESFGISCCLDKYAVTKRDP
jgi:hypothetical protein